MASVTGFGVGNKSGTGRAFFLTDSNAEPLIAAALNHSPSSAETELAGFQRARFAVANEFEDAISSSADPTLREILSAQSALLNDDELALLVGEEISAGEGAAAAVSKTVDIFIAALADATGAFKERIADLEEIKSRLIRAIAGVSATTTIPETGEWIVVAEDLTPLETSRFTSAIKGVVTRKGGPTSHTAIVCRQLAIPALVGCQDISALRPMELMTVDPLRGTAYLGAPASGASGDWWLRFPEQSSALIPILANVGSASDATRARELGAKGIGLLRSELALFDLTERPTRSEQAAIYSEILRSAPSGEVIFRTLDAGTDKPIPFLAMAPETNPALGIRGQRVEWIHPEFFQDQLLALRDAARKFPALKISVMAPMIATRNEALDFATQVRELGFESVGIMVEVPSIIEELGALSEALDFISVGTNDLSQYLFAADRQHEGTAQLLDPWQPALLRALARIRQQCPAIKMGICGEAASDPLLALVLAGIGVDSLSAALGSLSDLQAVARRTSPEFARAAAERALAAAAPMSARNAVLELIRD